MYLIRMNLPASWFPVPSSLNVLYIWCNAQWTFPLLFPQLYIFANTFLLLIANFIYLDVIFHTSFVNSVSRQIRIRSHIIPSHFRYPHFLHPEYLYLERYYTGKSLRYDLNVAPNSRTVDSQTKQLQYIIVKALYLHTYLHTYPAKLMTTFSTNHVITSLWVQYSITNE